MNIPYITEQELDVLQRTSNSQIDALESLRKKDLSDDKESISAMRVMCVIEFVQAVQRNGIKRLFPLFGRERKKEKKGIFSFTRNPDFLPLKDPLDQELPTQSARIQEIYQQEKYSWKRSGFSDARDEESEEGPVVSAESAIRRSFWADLSGNQQERLLQAYEPIFTIRQLPNRNNKKPSSEPTARSKIIGNLFQDIKSAVLYRKGQAIMPVADPEVTMDLLNTFARQEGIHLNMEKLFSSIRDTRAGIMVAFNKSLVRAFRIAGEQSYFSDSIFVHTPDGRIPLDSISGFQLLEGDYEKAVMKKLGVPV